MVSSHLALAQGDSDPMVPEFCQEQAIGPDRIFLGVDPVIIHEQGEGLFHAPPQVFDGNSLMLMDREYHNFLRKSDKFLVWKVIWL